MLPAPCTAAHCARQVVLVAVCLVGVLASATGAAAQSTNSNWAERERNRIAGILTYTDVTATITDTPLKQALKQIGEALELNIVGRFDDPRFGLGLDPEFPVTISVENVPAYAFIERILAMAEDEEPTTWQIRDGFVELGTKSRLSVPVAREVRTYEVSDLLRIENYYEGGGGGIFDSYRSRVREVQYDLAAELFDTILLTVEPEAWEPGPVGTGRGVDVVTPLRGGGHARPVRNTANLEARGKWASMHTIKWDRLVINAPDFIHRQVNGYPNAIRPKKDEDEKSAPDAANESKRADDASSPAASAGDEN